MPKKKVLVVEDNSGTRTMLEYALEFEGYQVHSVPDGLHAAEAIRLMNPDIVLLDVMMPGLDGFAVLKAIRNDEATKTLPVLMMTALDDAESTWKGWTGGCDYYMSKPFDTGDLLDVIQNLLSGVAA